MNKAFKLHIKFKTSPFTASLATAGVAILGYLLIQSSFAASNPLAGVSFYIDPSLSPIQQYETLKTTNPTQAAQIAKISTYPQANWLGGWISDPITFANQRVTAATATGKIASFILYNIPSRDCGSYSAGGSASHTAYRSWVDSVVSGIGMRRAVVVVEPDALPGEDCLDAAGKTAREASIKYAVDRLKTSTLANVYMDAGNSTWKSAVDMTPRLQAAGIAGADGFSLNVSGYESTDPTLAYGIQLSPMVGGKHFIIDTSRNGLGSNGQWCNPLGRALGTPPTTATASSLADAYMWLKTPGESDGTCNGGPSAGTFWLDYAIGLAERSSIVAAAPVPPIGPNPIPTPAPTPPPSNPNPSQTIYNDSSFTYNGTWNAGTNNLGTTTANKYIGDDHYSSELNASYSLSFNGTLAKLYATKASIHGIAAVSIDKGPAVLVDMYAPDPRQDQSLVFTTAVLPAGAHSISVVVTGSKNSASGGTTINADRIDITVPTTSPPPLLIGDVNGDGRVNALDLSLLLSYDGRSYAPADFDHNGVIGAADLSILLSKWTW